MGTWPWRELDIDELVTVLADPMASESLSPLLGQPACLVHRGDRNPETAPPTPATLDRIASLACVLVGAPGEDWSGPTKELIDVLPDDPDALIEPIGQHPIGAVALALLLRASERRGIGDGLHAESSVYSLLQSGPEFGTWLAARRMRKSAPAPPPPGSESPGSESGEPVVLVERDGDTLNITLNRPSKHNAFSREIRDALAEALSMAVSDESIVVALRGAGPSFCSGGDLDEFGSFADPAIAHLTRLTRSPTRVAAELATRTTAHLHGACLGAGIEITAFAATIVAHPGAYFGLPEIGLGLVPGAGGTVSLPRRIGRHRTALLALTATPIDATTAFAWGLIDEIRT